MVTLATRQAGSPESSTLPFCPQYVCEMQNKQMAKTQITAKMKDSDVAMNTYPDISQRGMYNRPTTTLNTRIQIKATMKYHLTPIRIAII